MWVRNRFTSGKDALENDTPCAMCFVTSQRCTLDTEQTAQGSPSLCASLLERATVTTWTTDNISTTQQQCQTQHYQHQSVASLTCNMSTHNPSSIRIILVHDLLVVGHCGSCFIHYTTRLEGCTICYVKSPSKLLEYSSEQLAQATAMTSIPTSNNMTSTLPAAGC